MNLTIGFDQPSAKFTYDFFVAVRNAWNNTPPSDIIRLNGAVKARLDTLMPLVFTSDSQMFVNPSPQFEALVTDCASNLKALLLANPTFELKQSQLSIYKNDKDNITMWSYNNV